MHAREYHRHSIRLKGYDYSQVGAYFVIICTHERRCLFGEVVEGQMVTNKFAEIVRIYWHELGGHYRDVALDAFVILPNHVHGVISIGDGSVGSGVVGAIHELPLRELSKRPGYAEWPDLSHRRSMLIPKIVGRFKMNTAKQINQIRNSHGTPVWQRNYWEHVIRTEDYLNRIREYVLNNPLWWHVDRENPERVGENDFDCWLQGLASLSRGDRLGTVPAHLPS